MLETYPEPSIWQALLLGVVQGLTEFLPISSSAHLRVVPTLLGWPDFGNAFTAIIHLGSLVAILLYFWQDLMRVIREFWQAYQAKDYDAEGFKLGLGTIIGTIPVVLAGALIKLTLGSPPRGLWLVALTSIVLAAILGWSEIYSRRARTVKDITIKDSVWIGLAQALAIIPGTSRSGSTITAALLLGFERESAAWYSFILGIPTIFLAGIVELISDVAETPDNWLGLVIGTVAAFISSYLAIDWLLKFLRSHSTWIFIIYRIAFGLVVIVGAATNVLT